MFFVQMVQGILFSQVEICKIPDALIPEICFVDSLNLQAHGMPEALCITAFLKVLFVHISQFHICLIHTRK